jgi:hypothetical protein
MPNTAESMGWATQVGTGTANPVTQQFEFISCDVRNRTTLVESPGIRGTRSHRSDSVNEGTITNGGTLVLEPRPDELDWWLPRILGATESTDVFAVAEKLPDFYMTVDKVARVYTYDGCKVAVARFAASGPGQNLRLSLEIEGKTETAAAAASFPSISETLSVLQPYIMHQGVLTLGGTARPFRNIEVSIDNGLTRDNFRNSQTRQQFNETDRIVRLVCDNPFTADEVDLAEMALAGMTGTLVFTNGARSITFSFANLKLPQEGVPIPGRTQPLPLRLNLQAFATASTKEIIVTNDSTGS